MTTQTSLEQVFSTHSDELYQAALLLTLDIRRAEQLLLRTVRNLATQPHAAPNALTFYAELLRALPAKAVPFSKLPWQADAAATPLLIAIAQLPAAQRLALDLLLRHDYTFEQAAPVFSGEPLGARQMLKAALLGLTPIATPEVPAALLTGDGAPEVCQQTRELLTVDSGVSFDPAVRGHLALCTGCRSAEQAWVRLRSHVERTLRAALRDLTLPPAVQASVVARFTPRMPLAQRRLRPRALQIALPAIVLLVVAALVLPWRTAPPTNAPGIAASSPLTPPHELLQQALTNLYAPTPGNGTWHSQYEIHWNFSETVYATLVGDLWMGGGGSYRAQLVHRDGGAPYEFLLANRSDNLWYSSTPLYGHSLYGPLYDAYASQVKIAALPNQQPHVWQERLALGAWGLAETYLQRGLAAGALMTWGRQRASNGNEQLVIGFEGSSPLGLAADVPNAPTAPTTMLLTIDLSTNRLVEIREVSGPAGGEQASRTVWRQLLDEHQPLDQSGKTFNIATAFNGPGQFASIEDAGGLADPALPMIPASAIQPATDIVSHAPGDTKLPAQTPPGTDRALVLAPHPFANTTVVYLGPGRLLQVNHISAGGVVRDFDGMSAAYSERTERGKQDVWLVPGVGMRFIMRLQENVRTPADQSTIRIQAIGFSRAELLAIADSTAPFDITQYIANVRLFRSPQPHDQQAFEALVGALQRQPLTDGQARRIIIQETQLQGQFGDALHDPYHLPFYPNNPTVNTTLWVKREAGKLAYTSQTRDADGKLVRQSLASGTREEWFDSTSNMLMLSPITTPPAREPITEPIWSVINLLGCGGTSMTTAPDGTRVISQTDLYWFDYSCNRSQFGSLLIAQLGGPDRLPHPLPANFNGYMPPADSGPYLLGAIDQPLVHRIFINAAGQAFRYELRPNGELDGPILESSEIVSDTVLAVASIPAGTFDGPPPAALITSQAIPRFDEGPRTTQVLSLTDVISHLTTPLWYVPPTSTITLRDTYGTLTTPDQYFASSNVFDSALKAGLAYQLAYSPPISDTSQLAQYMFVGSANRFGAFLRTQRAWQSSEPITVEVDGNQVNAWNVTLRDRTHWTLLERDGTLIALETGTPARFARLAALRRY